MFELIVSILCFVLFIEVCMLMFKIAWGATKAIALILLVLSVPTLIGGLLLTGGVILLLPVAMLIGAVKLIRA